MELCVARLTMSTDVIFEVDGYYGIQGKGLWPNQTFIETEVESMCVCRMRCFVHTACVAFSVRLSANGAIVCGLAREDVYNNTPSDVPEASYFVKKHQLDMKPSGKPWAIDRLIYRRLNTKFKGFNASKAACEAIPGFHLIAVRFEAQMSILLELCLEGKPSSGEKKCDESSRWFYVDMVEINNVTMIQGKIPLTDTDITSVCSNDRDKYYFIYAHSGLIHDEDPTSWEVNPVCQANVFGVSW
ncbi:uncharacterized protein LOC108675463 [Hyalella azteca]|uniref:Uncharacterized protein LOC108675463 n=1 Tax=Hyalella azteca TaxID=294128 RepID=A0A8B7P1M7_HYAAZ|nr:uncharacterized protein LOC108675463 [Hyalella azteca]